MSSKSERTKMGIPQLYKKKDTEKGKQKLGRSKGGIK